MPLKINLSLSSYYNRYLDIDNKNSVEIYYEKPTVRQLLSALQIPESDVGFVMVNNTRCSLNFLLHENDTVKILPALIGG